MVVKSLPGTVQRRLVEKNAMFEIPTDERITDLMEFLELETRTLELLKPVVPVESISPTKSVKSARECDPPTELEQ